MKLIYIAHPLVGDGTPEWGNLERNVERYLRFCALFCHAGAAVASWVHHHMMHSRQLTQGAPPFYLVRDARLLDGCDALVVAGPPQVSSGVRFEIRHAESRSIPMWQPLKWMKSEFWPDTGESAVEKTIPHDLLEFLRSSETPVRVNTVKEGK
jgi:hypothetical protein